MTQRDKLMIFHLAIGGAMALAGLAGLDQILAQYLRASGTEGIGVLMQGTSLLDTATGKEISKFLVGLAVTAFGLILLLPAGTRLLARRALFVGIVQLLGTTLTGVLKNVFGRLRPFELLQSGDWSHAWFVGGSAFPSGHAGFYFGLFLPLAYLFPRRWWALLMVPWFIAVARIDANHHFLSDVGVSIVIVAGLCLLFRRVAPFARNKVSG
ncbi:MAG TPA: phosphatase PAP2 family protein [Steroidobacteraceae bacterium]|nr:phosphatase PAP2 family protein [Steroidobacteraceae bacterium]